MINIHVHPTNPQLVFRYFSCIIIGEIRRAFTELWGTDDSGVEIPVCWLSGLVSVEVASTGPVVSLVLDNNWLKRAGARGNTKLND